MSRGRPVGGARPNALPAAGDQLWICGGLFEARGSRPHPLHSALERAQDIAVRSQTLRSIEAYREEHRLRALLAEAAGRIDR